MNAIAQPINAESTGEAIALHTLCSSCRKFTWEWDVLDHMPQIQIQESYTWQPILLYSARSWLLNQGSCHLCTLMHRVLAHYAPQYEQDENFKVYLDTRKRTESSVRIEVVAWSAENTQDKGRRHCANFELGLYDRKSCF